MRRNNRTLCLGFLTMVAASVIVYWGFSKLIKNQQPYMDYVQGLYESHSAVNLDASLNAAELSDFLMSRGYVETSDDALAIANHLRSIVEKEGNLRNLGSINIRRHKLTASYIDSLGGPKLKTRLEKSKVLIGQDSDFARILANTELSEVYCESDSADCVLSVRVMQEGKSIAGVPVRLNRHYYNEVEPDGIGLSQAPSDSIVAYAATNDEGRATFHVSEGFYSLIPIEPGFEFGKSKGSTRGILAKGTHKYSFERKQHSINIFSDEIYKAIRNEDAITVRTPGKYLSQIQFSLALILIAWWLAFIIIGFLGNRKRERRDVLILPVVMVLNSLGILVLFGASNPLLDRPLGLEMVYASLLGIVLMTIISQFSVARLFASGVKVCGRRLPFEPIPGVIKGTSFLCLSIALIVLLAIFGSAPEGSSAKVNLFFIQPSEICKYLFVIFMAAYFADNADSIKAFAETTNRVSLRLHVRTVAVVILSIVFISLLYMGVVSDMGPALVLLVTFILMYSVARRDVGQLIIGIVSFVVITYVFDRVWGTTLSSIAAPLVWLILWLAFGWLYKKTIFESAIFFNLLIVLFIAGGPILQFLGFSHQATRLNSRMEMAGAGVWNNLNSEGGDQVAQAIWGYSAGGFHGQGIGLGNANLTPAYHTDLILSALGEQMGFIWILVVIVGFSVILYRALSNGQKAGNPFSFYLAAGIGLVTVIQFSIIALGTVGLIPLTGVAVPFMSYAKTSVVCNLAALGLLVAVSKESAGTYQTSKMKEYKTALRTSFITMGLVCCAFGYSLWGYMVSNRDETIIRTGIFADDSGFRRFEYNPRIKALVNKLQIQPIYDRNGKVLATSENTDDSAEVMRSKRYYPFGAHTFFMVGDYNSKIQWTSAVNNPYGYNAEYRFLSTLRGFDNIRKTPSGMPVLENIQTNSYRPSRFLPAMNCNLNNKEMQYDYRELLPLLKNGEYSRREVKVIKKEGAKPVNLTIDAELQVRIQNRMVEYVQQNQILNSLDRLRISAVILDSKTGDLLTSANYPLPDMEILDSLEHSNIHVYSDNYSNSKAHTDRDLGLTYQTHPGSTGKVMTALSGFIKNGNEAASAVYDIDFQEIIENGRVKEPYSSSQGRRMRNGITMEEAIVKSSNCYFVNFLNDNNTYRELGQIYEAVGVRLDGHEGRRNITPYFFNTGEFKNVSEFEEEIDYLALKGSTLYRKYQEERKAKSFHKMSRNNGSADFWGIAYGQGQLYATPLNMARVGTIVANNGKYIPTRYTMTEATEDTKQLVPSGTALLRKYMEKEADKHRIQGADLPVGAMSKTGTPERSWLHYDENGRVVEEKPNDGWYMCIVPAPDGTAYYTIVVRLERLGSAGSSTAVRFTSDVILPAMRQCGYLPE